MKYIWKGFFALAVGMVSVVVHADESKFFEPELMSEDRAVLLVEDIDRKHNIIHSEDQFQEFVYYFMQMERDFVNNINVFSRMKECSPTLGQIRYSPSVGTRFKTFVSVSPMDGRCHYMSETEGVPEVSVCVFADDEMTAASEEGVALYKKAYENINQGIYTQILDSQPIFKSLLSPENCDVVEIESFNEVDVD